MQVLMSGIEQDKINDLLNGHLVIRRTNSGMEYCHTKQGKSSVKGAVSRSWMKTHLDEHDYNELMNGEVIGKTVKRGRGYSYVEYVRVKHQ